jgi:hypothetical protein
MLRHLVGHGGSQAEIPSHLVRCRLIGIPFGKLRAGFRLRDCFALDDKLALDVRPIQLSFRAEQPQSEGRAMYN